MISVILTILKIIGIAILALLSMLLIIILTILFVPIRYRVNAEHGKVFELGGSVSWLLHIVHARIHYSQENRRIMIRILGILVYDSLRPSKTKKVKPIKKRTVHKKDKDIQETEPIVPTKETVTEDEDIDSGDIKTDDISLLKTESEDKEPIQISDKGTKDEKKSVGKLKRFFKRIKSKIIGFYKKLKNKIKNTIQKLLNIRHKVSLVLDFLRNEINKEGFRFTFDSIIKIFKHIKPKKLKSSLIFGTGDPCSTGQILGLFGIVYSFYGNDIKITPDFENKVFEGSHYARGRIRIWTILIIVIKLLLDKRFKELKMNYQLLKEAL